MIYLLPSKMRYKILSLSDGKEYNQAEIPNLKGHILKVILK